MAILAYSPVLHLVESHVAIYKIYVLKNPFTKEIFYVGQTLQEIETRLYGHIKDTETNKQKSTYIQAILDQGAKPEIEAIETIQGTCYIDKLILNEREKYWIRYYKSAGCTLLNIASMGENGKCAEYHSYLSSLKKGQTSWHYYYCGKTRGGVKVYDEKRLMADGFRLPIEKSAPKSYEPVYDEGYNPWYNDRFLKMIGRINAYNDTQYDFCYKDTDPNFYDDDY